MSPKVSSFPKFPSKNLKLLVQSQTKLSSLQTDHVLSITEQPIKKGIQLGFFTYYFHTKNPILTEKIIIYLKSNTTNPTNIIQF